MSRCSLLLLVCFALLVSSGELYTAYAIDSLTKIQLRNSYKQFEKCMKDHSNDITECLEAFNKAVDTHKDALKSEPANENIKNTLLQLVNAMNDIAETYYSTAESKKGIEPTLSKKYYIKAAICYKQLVNLYPNKVEFKEVLTNAKYLSKYEEVEEYIFEFKNRKRLDYALLTLQKLKASRNSFNSSFGQDEKLNNNMNEVVAQLEKKVNRLFQEIVQKQNPNDMGSLIYLIQAQLSIIDFHETQVYKENLLKLETTTISIIKDLKDSYGADFKRANNNFKKGEYSAAAKAFDQLLVKMESFPEYSTAKDDLKVRISKATNNFDIDLFRNTVSHKTQVAKDTDNFLSMMENGKRAFKQKDWVTAYDTFEGAGKFVKGKQPAVNVNVSQKWFNKVQEEIDDLDNDEITSLRLAKMYYKPMSYSEWLGIAKNGKFSKNYVSLSGSFQQKIDDVVILKKGTIEYDFTFEVAYQSEQMNSVGIIFKKKRLFKEGNYISCIGKFKKIDKFKTLLGEKIELPVFKVIYIDNK